MTTRITGLGNSGLDIDTLVQQLMSAEKSKYNKLTQQTQTLQWQQDDYRTLNTKILDMKNTAYKMTQSFTFQTKKVSVADDTALAVSSSSKGNLGNYKMKVKQLAESAFLTSNTVVGATANGGETAKLSDVASSFTGTAVITIGGEKGTAAINVSDSDTVASFVSAVNSKSAITGVKVNYDKTMDQFFFVSTTTGKQSKIELTSTNDKFIPDVLKLDGTAVTTEQFGTITGSKAFLNDQTPATPSTSKLIDETLSGAHTLRLNISGDATAYEFTVNKSTSIGSLINQINSSGVGKAGFSAYLDSDGNLNIVNPDQAGKTITFSDQSTSDGKNIVDALGLPSNSAESGNPSPVSKLVTIGKNAIVNFNGNTIDAEYNTNTFTINELTITAKKADPSNEVNFSVIQDTDTIYNTIKAFIDKYNDMISAIDTKISESHDRSYTPLTDDQREAMTDDQITKWEAKAKSGLLKNDSILKNALSVFRLGFSSSVAGLPQGTLQQMSQIGINTGSFLNKGKLEVDEITLRQAITERPDEVMALFISDDGNSTTSDGDGLGVRLYNETTAIVDQIKEKAGNEYSLSLNTYEIGKNMYDLASKLTYEKSRLATAEDNYYKKFTAMEQALNKLNSQSQSLIQKMSGQ